MSNLFINFSDWIIAWFILYKFKIIKYNPKIFILFGIIDNIIGLIIKMNITYKNKNKIKNNMIHFMINKNTDLVVHFIIKILMFYLSRNTFYTVNDFKVGVIFLLIYIIWLYIVHDLTFFDLKKKTLNKYISKIFNGFK